MKPVFLKLKNIGPYRDQELDFTRLDNMFLITGNTGAGKTFIFDAMTYALYGTLKGGRDGLMDELKSRFADEDEESYVDFTFEIGGDKYRCYRTTPYFYTNRSGKRTKKSQSVEFYKQENNKWVCVSEKKSIPETDASIQKLIGLSSAEFAQIILLPQGYFADFLRQKSTQRKETLQKIFPVVDYTYLIETIKQKKDEADKILNEKLAVIGASEKEYDFSDGENQIQEMDKLIASLTIEENELIKNQKDASGRLADIKRDLEEAKKNEENENQLKELKSKKSQFKELKIKINLAQEALVLSAPLKSKKDAETRVEEDKTRLEEAEKQLNETVTLFNQLNSQSEEMDELKNGLEKDKAEMSGLGEKLKNKEEYNQCVSDIEDFLEKEKEFKEEYNRLSEQLHNEEVKSNTDDIEKSIDDIGKKLLEKSNAVVINKGNLEKAEKRDKLLQEKRSLDKENIETQQKLKESDEKKSILSKEVEDLTNRIEEMNSHNQAFALVDLLKPDCPCPVCGSLSHPSPAKRPEQLSNEKELLESKKETLKYIEEAVIGYENTLSTSNADLKNVNNQLKELESVIATDKLLEEKSVLEKENKALEDEQKFLMNLRNSIKEIKENKDSAERQWKDAENKLKSLNDKKRFLEKQFGDSIENLLAREESLKELVEKNSKIIGEWEKAFEAAQGEKIACETKVANCRQNLESDSEVLEKAKQILEGEVKKSSFESINAVEKAFIEQDELAEINEEYKAYEDKLSLYTELVEKAKKIESSVKIEERFALETQKLQEGEEIYNQLKNQLDEKKSFRDGYKKSYEKIKIAQKEYEEKKKEIEPLNRLYNDLSGKNPQKLTFDAWALGMYFEQVVEFASNRFEQISGGRFRFKLKNLEDDVKGNNMKGLDLQVWDLNTDELADPKSLSGGETFEASISLALALTDVVQNAKGGIKLDSLFIDEGFGTLDPEALDKAMSVFTELGETKMVGIISHVEGLQTLIPSAINVTKNKTGSTLQIV